MSVYKIACGSHTVHVIGFVEDLREVVTRYVVEVYDQHERHMLLDFVSSYEDGCCMAENFNQCYRVAERYGYTLKYDRFIHPSGRAIHVSEAADIDTRVVLRFQRAMKRALKEKTSIR